MRLNRILRTMVCGNHALVRATTEDELFQNMCRVIVETGGYRMAWVGQVEHDEEESIRPLAHAGYEASYLALTKPSWGDNPYGSSPAGMSVRTGATQFNNDITVNPLMGPWTKPALDRQYFSSISLPLRDKAGVFGALTIYASEANAFGPEEVALLEELADDVSYGVSAQRTRSDHDEMEQRLRLAEERGRVEEALRQSEERYRLLVEQAVDGIFLSDAAGRYVDVNSAGCKMLGYARDEILSRAIGDLLAPEEVSRLALEFNMLIEGQTTRSEWRFRRKDGSEIVGDVVGRQLPDGYLLGILRDITERKQAEEAVRASEEKFRALFENMQDGCAYCRMLYDDAGLPVDFIYLAVNAAFHRLTGMENVVGKRVTELLPGIIEANPEVFETYGRVARTGQPERFEIAFKPLARWLAVSAYCPGPNHFVATFNDITERKKVEEALRASESRLRRFYDSGLIGVIYWNMNGEIIDANDKFLEMIGYERSDLTSGRIDWRELTPPEFRHLDEASVAELKATGVNSAPFEKAYLRRDGSPLPVMIGGAMLDEQRFNGVAFVIDISEQKRAKEKTEEILSSIADGFYALDGEWRFIYFNASAERMLSKKREEVIGRTIFDAFPLFQDSPLHANYREAMTDTKPVAFQCMCPTIKRWSAFNVYPTPAGGVSVYFRDISAEKAIADELVNAKAEAERANLAKSKFLAAASHDLRQPVQSLTLLLSALERQVKDKPKAANMVSMANASMASLNSMLTGILDISRLDAGVITPDIASVDLGALIDRMAREYAPRAVQVGLVLRHVPSVLLARTDIALLERILRNLIENALRYTSRGGVLLGARPRGERVRIDVIDTGVGIPAEQQNEIFEEFRQLNNPARDSSRGLGLGLAIVSRLASLIGCEIHVASRLGHGTRFSLLLPSDHSAAAPAQSAAAVEDPGGRILIIEDNVGIRQAYEIMLGDWGYDTLSASSGEEAIERATLENWRFDAIVADHRLGPGLTGNAAAKEIARRAGRSYPTMVITGDTAEERLTEVSASGFALLHKPVDADDLRRALASLLRGGIVGLHPRTPSDKA